MPSKLGLDEALVSVNRLSNLSPIEVFYQIDECYGCSLEKLTSLNSSESLEDFVIGTKYRLNLEFRQSKESCNLKDLSLNNNGHYRIDISSAPNSTQLDCSMKTLSSGDCYLCPFAILLCILLGLTAIEKCYEHFWLKKDSKGRRKLDTRQPQADSQPNGDDNHPESSGANNQSIIGDDTKPITEVNLDDNIDLSNGLTQHQQIVQQDQQTQSNSISTRSRIESLDVFRGLTIAGMIVVNYGGAGYTFLEHKAWDGMTLADFVFPFFIFSMGASIAISTKSQARKGLAIGATTKKILRRALILMALGLSLNSKWLNGRDLSHLRITGVLQRFSISYLVVAMMYTIELLIETCLKSQSITRVRLLPNMICGLFETLTAFDCVAIYVYVTFYFEYSTSCPVGYTGPGGQTEGGRYANCTGGAANWLDHLILGENHLYHGQDVKEIFKTQISHDPEGILGYSTSILLTLFGLQCGKGLINNKTHKARLLSMAQWFVVLAGASSSAIAIPINKRLWSFSFVAVTGTSAFIIMILLYVLVDIYNRRKSLIIRLLSSAGKNAIFLYVGHSLLSGMLPWHFAVDSTSHLQLLLRLAWSTFCWLLAAHYMALKGLFIKI